MVNFKSSGFDKGTGGKSGKFQFDCDGCILFTRRSINITNSFSFSLHNLPFYTVFRSRAIANITGLILLHKSLRLSDRNSIIDCNFCNTWRVFGAKLIGGFHVTSSPPCWWTVNKRSLISSLCSSTSIC